VRTTPPAAPAATSSTTNNGGGAGTFDLQAGTAIIGAITDTFPGFEDLQGSEGNDLILGSGGRNRLTGGGGDDTIRGRDGIDVIVGREAGGDPDLELNCGAGDNSEEKAVVDPEDPPPISC
jgi:Ca2+-binding RTX toxin-like protein